MALARTDDVITLTIADEGTLSDAGDISRFINASITLVTAWTSAAITFQGCDTLGGTYANIYDATGTEVTIPAATHSGRAYEIPAAVMNFRYIKVRSGTSGSAVTQSNGPYTIKINAKT